MLIISGVSLSEVSKRMFGGASDCVTGKWQKVSQVLVKFLNLSEGPTADVRIGLR